MNCLEARRQIGGLDGMPTPEGLAGALDHAATCPRCRAVARRLADDVLAAAGDELSCAEARRRLPVLVAGSSGAARSAAQTVTLRGHLAVCEDCRAELALVEAMLSVDPLRIELPERRWDTGFAAQAPLRPVSHSHPQGGWPQRLGRIWRQWTGRPVTTSRRAGSRDERRPAWALAGLTAILLLLLVRVLLGDPQVQRSLERLLPAWSDPRPTVDLAALRAAATGAAAAKATATAAAATAAAGRSTPGSLSGSPRPGATASPEAPRTATASAAGTDAPEGEEQRRSTPRSVPQPSTPGAADPPEATAVVSPAATEAPYPPPDPGHDPPSDPYPDPPTASPVEPPEPTLAP